MQRPAAPWAGDVSERVLTVEDVRCRGTRVWLVNSVQGWRRAAVLDS